MSARVIYAQERDALALLHYAAAFRMPIPVRPVSGVGGLAVPDRLATTLGILADEALVEAELETVAVPTTDGRPTELEVEVWRLTPIGRDTIRAAIRGSASSSRSSS